MLQHWFLEQPHYFIQNQIWAYAVLSSVLLCLLKFSVSIALNTNNWLTIQIATYFATHNTECRRL